jgi:hypothetical protein
MTGVCLQNGYFLRKLLKTQDLCQVIGKINSGTGATSRFFRILLSFKQS